MKKRSQGELSVYLGGDSSLEGLLTFDGQARIDGHFKGEIKGTGTLIVGPHAHVQAGVQADAVVISGEIEGDVVAGDRIELRAPGKLKGNINAPLVVMDEGVVFEGHCTMSSEDAKDKSANITLLASGAS